MLLEIPDDLMTVANMAKLQAIFNGRLICKKEPAEEEFHYHIFPMPPPPPVARPKCPVMELLRDDLPPGAA